MGFYSGIAMDSGVDSSFDGIQECYSTNFTEEAIMGVAESENNFNKIMKTIGIYEASVFAETGEEAVYTEGAFGSIVETVKKFLLSVWNKIKALFKRFVMMFDQFTKSDADFLKKYKDQVNKRVSNLKDFTYKGYKFDVAAIGKVKGVIESTTNGIGKSSTAIKDATNSSQTDKSGKRITKLVEDINDKKDKMRGELLSHLNSSYKGSYDDSEFNKALFEIFRSGDSEKSNMDITGSEVSAIYNQLANSSHAKKDVNTVYTANKRAFDSMIKDLENADKEAMRDTDDKKRDANNMKSRYLQYEASCCRFMSNCIHVIDGAYLTAMKDYSRQCKSIMVKIISNVRAGVGESAGWEHPYYEEQTSSLLDDVDLK